MCSIAFRHASGEVPLDHEKNTQIIHLFPPTNRSWGKVGRGANAECDNCGETVANMHPGGYIHAKVSHISCNSEVL